MLSVEQDAAAQMILRLLEEPDDVVHEVGGERLHRRVGEAAPVLDAPGNRGIGRVDLRHVVRVEEDACHRGVALGAGDGEERDGMDLRLVVGVSAVDDPVAHEGDAIAGLRHEPVEQVAAVRGGHLVPGLAGERARRPVGAVRDEPLFQLDVLGVGGAGFRAVGCELLQRRVGRVRRDVEVEVAAERMVEGQIAAAERGVGDRSREPEHLARHDVRPVLGHLGIAREDVQELGEVTVGIRPARRQGVGSRNGPIRRDRRLGLEGDPGGDDRPEGGRDRWRPEQRRQDRSSDDAGQ